MTRQSTTLDRSQQTSQPSKRRRRVRMGIAAAASAAALVTASASPALADPGQQPMQTAATDNPGEWDCGWFTCTIRFNHQMTKNARDASQIIGAAAVVCAYVTGHNDGDALELICATIVTPSAIYYSVMANRFDDVGNCLGIRYNNPKWYGSYLVVVAYATEVHHGTFNCL